MGAPVEDSGVEIPKQLNYLYDIYLRLRFSRVPNDDGFSLVSREPLTFSHLDYYSRNSGLDFMQWEIDCIMSLDSIFERCSNG